MSWNYSNEYMRAYKAIKTLYTTNDFEKSGEFINRVLIGNVKNSLEKRWLEKKLHDQLLQIHVERNMQYNAFPDYETSKKLLNAEEQSNKTPKGN